RRRLRVRLTRRGVTLSAGAVAGTALPRKLVQAALASASPDAAAATAGSARAVALAEGAVRAPSGTRWQCGTCLVLLLARGGAGVGGLAGRPPQLNRAPLETDRNQAPRRADDPLARRVRQAVTRATDYLKREQKDGSWEWPQAAAGYRGGFSSLALW